MKSDDILDAIGAVDDKCVERAKKNQKSKRRGLWITVGAAAACLALVLMMLSIQSFIGVGGEVNNAAPPANGMETVTVEKDVWIYYVDGAEIRKESEYLPCVAKDVFHAWKVKNKIGNDVEFIEVKIDSNGTTEISEFNGEKIAQHKAGDSFVYNITISAELQKYYHDTDSELLLESLKQTMTGYLDMEFDGYNLILA